MTHAARLDSPDRREHSSHSGPGGQVGTGSSAIWIITKVNVSRNPFPPLEHHMLTPESAQGHCQPDISIPAYQMDTKRYIYSTKLI